MFASLEGKGGEGFERRKEQVKKVDDIERGMFWGFIFLHNTTNLSSFWATKKIVLEEGFVLEGLHEFFKFNLCSYNIFKIKNTLIVSINLSFF